MACSHASAWPAQRQYDCEACRGLPRACKGVCTHDHCRRCLGTCCSQGAVVVQHDRVLIHVDTDWNARTTGHDPGHLCRSLILHLMAVPIHLYQTDKFLLLLLRALLARCLLTTASRSSGWCRQNTGLQEIVCSQSHCARPRVLCYPVQVPLAAKAGSG